MAGQLTTIRFQFTVATSATVSNEQDCRALQILAFHMPAAWTAGGLTFRSRPIVDREVSANSATQIVVDDAGATIGATVAAGQYVVLTGDQLDAMAAVAFLTLISPNPQAADREVLAVCAPLALA